MPASAAERLVGTTMAGVRLACGLLLVLMVVFTVYTVVMRYVFHDPPFWGDTLSVFCNVWLTMLGYSLAVRDREDIALRGFYGLLPPLAGSLLDMFWNLMVACFGLYLVWFGWEAAWNVPGMYWELGGLRKTYPLLVLPLSGVLVTLAASMLIVEDALALAGRRPMRKLDVAGEEPI